MDIWYEGKYVDVWAIIHVLMGCIFAEIAAFTSLNIWIELLIATAIMIGWEIFEDLVGIEERFTNKVFDVITGWAGYAFVLYLQQIGAVQSWTRLIIFLALWAGLNLWGNLDYYYKGKPSIFKLKVTKK